MKIRDATQLIALLEDGDLAHDLSEEIRSLLEKLRDAAGPKSKAKGSITLTLNFAVEGVTTEIDTEISTRAPKAKRGRSFYFVADDGLSTDHPKQQQFPFEAKVSDVG
jgi:hypothetical protein